MPSSHTSSLIGFLFRAGLLLSQLMQVGRTTSLLTTALALFAPTVASGPPAGRRWPFCAAARLARAMASISFWDRSPPFAAAATAKLGGVPVELKADTKLTKESVATLMVAG